MTKVEIPWERYATIAFFADKVKLLGKTALQKLVYFLQEWKNVPLGYNFELYTYGPFSADLMGDLDYSETLGAVRIDHIINGGYNISPADQNAEVQQRAVDFFDKHLSALEEVVVAFGKLSAWQLELRATLYFAYLEMASKPDPFDDDDLMNILRSLKPGKFNEDQIRQAISDLRYRGVISACNASCV